MPKALSVASFNLLNLAEPGQVTHQGSQPLDQATYDRKVRWIADKLTDIRADLIGFQEVWSVKALTDCFVAAGLEDKYTLVARDGPPGLVQVAAAVRKTYPVAANPDGHWIEDFPPELQLIKRPPKRGKPLNTMHVEITKFSRPILALTLQMEAGLTLRFCVIHLKSKLPMDLDDKEADDPKISVHRDAIGSALSTIRRTAEVAALRVWLNKELRDTRVPYVVAGDMNDGHLSNTAAILSAQPPQKLFAASRVGAKPSKAGDVGLYSAQMLQEFRSLRDVYYTYVHENVMESLDHIFVSEEFYDHSPNRIWTFRELKVLNDHIHFRAKGDKIRTDHGIVIARFDAAKTESEPEPPIG